MSIIVDVTEPVAARAMVTRYDELPHEGRMHPNITKYSCDLADDFPEVPAHPIRRAAYFVEFLDPDFAPIAICHHCARTCFGVEGPT